MERFLRKSVLAAALILFETLPAVDTAPGAVETQRKDTEKESIAALTRLGVPVHVDTRGSARWIEASGAELSDEAMRYMPGLKNLEWLEIGSGSVTASGVAHLKECATLKRLYIHDVNLKDDPLEWLSRLTNLEALSLQRTGIDGRALRNITSPNLVVLNVSGNNIVDADMKQIAKMHGLEVLALADTKITGEGLASLEGMARLNELNLVNCAIQDTDLELLLTMPNLRIVYAEGCNISPMAVHSITSRFQMLAIFQ